ncbi:PilX N-terminal domain-containing pilus assembly protein [candidate division KSB1 bacterium]|nr:PilX N-terminal domain-containing pilus assembly protein [candidate division KSB1 bacterium]
MQVKSMQVASMQVANEKQKGTSDKQRATSNQQPATSYKQPATRHALADSQGSALVLVLVMVTVITTIVGAVLMGTLLQLRLIVKEKHRLQAFYLAEAGIYKAIWHLSGNGGKDIFWRPENTGVEIFDHQMAAVTVQQWGGFLQVTSTANVHRAGKSIRVLLGEQPPAPFRQAVFVGCVDYPLVVTGRNRIVGDVTVGPEGVKKGRIKGRDFEGDKLVDGKVIRQSRPQMPYFNPLMLETVFREYLDALENPSGEQVFGDRTFVDGEMPPLAEARNFYVHGDVQLNYSDANTTIHGPGMISSTGNIVVQNHTQITGYVELIAVGKIIVKDEARLENCVLFARQGIEVSGDGKIEGQLFSPSDIVLKERAALSYPSLVYCPGATRDQTWQGQISLQDQAAVRGTVILFPDKKHNDETHDATILSLGKNAKVVGAVYSRNYTNQQGTIYGTVVTGQFFLYESPTIYLNWLQDAVTDRAQLPEGFLLPIGFNERPRLEVLKWEELK